MTATGNAAPQDFRENLQSRRPEASVAVMPAPTDSYAYFFFFGRT
jgi:hypothetical protein